MHALIENGEVKQYPYGADVLRRDNPQTSFPRNPTPELLATFNVFPVRPTERPEFDPMTQRVEEGTPVRQQVRNPDGTFRSDDPATTENEAWEWVQVWNVTPLSAEEIAQLQADRAEQTRQQRQAAYQAEADPLFFKAQRGEATHQEWLDKVAEIKVRFPEPS